MDGSEASGRGVEDVLKWLDDVSKERHKKYLLLESNYLTFVDQLQELLDPSTGMIRVRPSSVNTKGVNQDLPFPAENNCSKWNDYKNFILRGFFQYRINNKVIVKKYPNKKPKKL